MTLEKVFRITCNDCYEDTEWGIRSLRDYKAETLRKNAGYSKVSREGFFKSDKHYCPDCNDREKQTFYIVGGYGDEYLGEVEAWGKVDARTKSSEKFNCEPIECESRKEAMKEIHSE